MNGFCVTPGIPDPTLTHTKGLKKEKQLKLYKKKKSGHKT
jgi:hypothetical protein